MPVPMEPLFERLGYIPHPKQWLFHKSGARFRIPCCGRRFGKSHMAARDLERYLFDPKTRYWIVGPTYDLAEKEFRVIWDDLIIGQQLGRDKRVKKAYSKRSGEMWIEFPWGARVECRSSDHPENLVGEKLNGAIMSEAAKHRKDTWERFIRPALADARGWASFPTTPEGQNWLYHLWQLGQDPGRTNYDSWQFPSWDNPYIYPGGRQDPEILEIEGSVLKPFFDQEIAALFNAFVGKIFEAFSEVVHVKQHTFNPDWPNYMAFDWGFVNPLAAIEFQVAPDDTVYIWREHYKAGWILNEHIQFLKARKNPPGYRLDLCFGDAAEEKSVVEVSRDFAPCYADIEAKKNWKEGVELVNSFIKLRQVGVADEYGTPLERPWLFVDGSCKNTIREFNNYRAPSVAGRVERNPREDAQKFDDHALDAIRYALMHIFKLGATQSLASVYSLSQLRESREASTWYETPTGLTVPSSGGFFTTTHHNF